MFHKIVRAKRRRNSASGTPGGLRIKPPQKRLSVIKNGEKGKTTPKTRFPHQEILNKSKHKSPLI
jgi:hypothetical protein